VSNRAWAVGCGVVAAIGVLCGCGGLLSFLFLTPQGRAVRDDLLCQAGERSACPELPPPQAPPEAFEPPAPPSPPPPPPPPPPVSREEPRTSRPARRSNDDDVPGLQVEGGRPPSPIRVGGEIKQPRRLGGDAPVYPDIARQARVQGVVILEATVSPQGRVTDIKVLRGIPLLDEAAIDAVKTWTYTPTLLNGVPVPVIMTVTVNFKLQ